jgi:hypothetical protein
MSSTTIIAGDAVNGLSQAAGNDGTLAIQVGPSGAKVNAIALGTDGTPTLLKQPAITTAQSMVQVNTANGYGSTNTCIRRWTTTAVSQGSDITYADSATLGGSFTINTNGVYSVNYTDQFSAGSHIAITLNDSQPSTVVDSLTFTPLQTNYTSSASAGFGVSWTGYLAAGSVIRAHANATSSGSRTNLAAFTITRVA